MDRTQIQNQIKSNKPHKRLPEWAKRPLGRPSVLHELKSTLRKRGLSTVCESARCPNIGECFSKPTATFMILGSVCTRKCTFCNVTKNEQAQKTDSNEPENIALTSFEMGLKHVVVTSVTRDDLSDGGASHFASTIKALRDKISGISVEVLTPDFNGVKSSLEKVFLARPNIFNH
ncbi:MAG: lipoyl synthase, partial [Deltaproteobacteria bacterium]|nr:lipoyl synthase [Deltaproteobacteria bacterium]